MRSCSEPSSHRPFRSRSWRARRKTRRVHMSLPNISFRIVGRCAWLIVLSLWLVPPLCAQSEDKAEPTRIGEAAIERAMAEETEFEFDEVLLSDALGILSQRHKIKIVLD